MKKLMTCFVTTVFLTMGFTTHTYASTYKVKSGDTLSAIAKKQKVTVSQIKAWNKLKSDLINVNQVLQINPTTKKTTTKTSAKPGTPYKVIKMKATAYTGSCKGCSGKTATGLDLKKNPNLKVISVDPKVIPLGSKVYVDGYGYAIAGDTGGSLKGNKIDVFIPNQKNALKWGVKTVTVKVYKK
ncbi:3D domain-containing protein [Gottfriedia luciferensis]|uniref:3D domain-containing protein n=1 Tax=Gottfriedia luciferensis TaxID=178774 RepID=UPI000B434132|nr:3D domain-containing protein [Gottfriedia luciferensis]